MAGLARSARLHGARLDCLARNVLLQRDLERVIARLRRRGVPVVALKGYALLHTVYRDDPSSRPMADVDLLVPSRELDHCRRALVELGFSRIVAEQASYVSSRDRSATRIDLHTRIWYLSEAEQEKFFARCRWATGSPTGLLVPAVEDHLVLVVAHAVLGHGQLRPAWTEDIRRLVSACTDWGSVTRRAQDTHLTAPLFVALSRLAREGVALPESVLETLRPRGWNRWRARILERVLDRPEVPDIGHLLRFIGIRGVRPTLRQVGRQLLPAPGFLHRRYELETPRGVLLQRFVRPFSTSWKLARLLGRLALGIRSAPARGAAS